MFNQEYGPQASGQETVNTYTVEQGDTFYFIACFYNIVLDDLLEANPWVDPDTLAPGQVLRIPVSLPSANCPLGANTYFVQKGDTFFSISKKFGISLSTLLRANAGINPDGLLIGQSLCIPTTWSIYRNETLGAAFSYPFRWRRIDPSRYAGIDGFFEIFCVAEETLEEACKTEVFHKHKPYGSMPEITTVTVQGRTSRLVYPSEDQPHEMRGQAVLITGYAVPLLVSGALYHYLVLRADKEHMRGIIHSFRFLTSETAPLTE